MSRLIARLLAVVLLIGAISPIGAVPVANAAVEGAITWLVDHNQKTITVTVKLQLYSGCSGNPAGDESERASACRLPSSMLAPPTQFLADKIKSSIERIWNKGYRYRCYELKVVVDIKIGSDRSSLDPDRIAVRIDPSPTDIRSYVHGTRQGTRNWESDNPADALSPDNDGDPTTWGELESAQTYAHEFGHIIGLDDAYRDVVGPDGSTSSQPYPTAPVDLMSTSHRSIITQETIDRLIKRNLPNMRDTEGNPVTDDDLVCDYQMDISNGQAWLRTTKCNGKEGAWKVDVYAANGSGKTIGDYTFTLPERGDSANVTAQWTAKMGPGESTWNLTGRVTFVQGEDRSPSKLSFSTLIGTWTVRAGGTSRSQDTTTPPADLPLREGKFCN